MSLIEHLSIVEDTQSSINQKHDLVDIIFLVISDITAGSEGWQDIERYGEHKLEWLRKYRTFAHGTPRRHTVARILRSVVAESLLEALALWINEQRENQSKPVIT
ncbi:transposase family protein, partial [Vibrio sp. 10N.222.55.C6]|uniref:transposase family protein n=1 Tax=Vibrio sp. 10N.222.55.C6 TaxID=3229649 RepID=UPI0035536CB3